MVRTIDFIKVSGICFSVYGKNENAKLLNDVMELLIGASGADTAEIKSLKDEINILDELFKNFFSLMNKAEFDKIPEESQVSSFLVASENVIGAVLEYSSSIINANVSWEKIKNKYPMAQRPMNIDNGPLESVKDLIELGAMYDNCVVYAGEVIKYFYYKKMPFVGNDKILLKDNTEISMRYLKLFDLFDRLKFTYESWMFGDCILRIEGDNIFFYPIDEYEYLSREVSLFRFNHLRNQKVAEYSREIKKINFHPTTRDFFPEGLRNHEEVFSGMLCEELLGSYELKDKVLGVAISVWLRAFTIINEIGKKVISERQVGLSLSVKDWCLLKDRQEWIDDFVQGGIEAEDAKVIIDELIFARGVGDILDCPYIDFEGKLLCLPSTITSLDASQSLLSNFSRKGLDISFKGYKFQDDVNSLINKSGISAYSLKESRDGVDYECDSFFRIADDLYFIECKSFIQPRTPQDYYELLAKVSDASEQLLRISGYFSCVSEDLRKKLKVDKNWKPHKINNIILSKANFGSSIFLNGCYAVDESVFVRFFSRESFAIIMGDDRLKLDDLNLLGEITNDKLINYIKNPPQIKFIKDNYVKVERRVKIDSCVFNFIDFKGKVPLFGFYNEQ